MLLSSGAPAAGGAAPSGAAASSGAPAKEEKKKEEPKEEEEVVFIFYLYAILYFRIWVSLYSTKFNSVNIANIKTMTINFYYSILLIISQIFLFQIK